MGKVRKWWVDKVRRFWFFFKGRRYRVSLKFHIFVSDVNQGNQEVGWVHDYLAWDQGWKDSP